VLISTDLNVYPNVPFGAPITVMESQHRVRVRPAADVMGRAQ